MAGGIERMAILMMNQMVKKGFRVGLITWDPAYAEAHYPLDGSVEWMRLDLGAAENKAGWGLRLSRQIALRKLVRKFQADVAIGFQVGTFLAARTAMLGLGIPMIAAERNAPDLFDFVSNGDNERRKANLALRMADCITVQMESYKEKYPTSLKDRIVTIPNPVQPIDNPEFPNERNHPPKRILNVGRLSYQKNQTFLIKSFSKIASSNTDWVLTLVGAGEKRSQIEQLIHDLNLEEKVELVGSVTDVDEYYKKSSFLAFPSLWEGFPNALVESFRQGLPAVGLKQTAGVNELLKHQESGLLSDKNEASFASAMQVMINDLKFRKKAGRKARESILQYDPETIFIRWSELFKSLANKH